MKKKTYVYYLCICFEDLPRAAIEIIACACPLTFARLISGHRGCGIGKRVIKSSRKSNGVTDETSHFSLLNTINSQFCNETKQQ